MKKIVLILSCFFVLNTSINQTLAKESNDRYAGKQYWLEALRIGKMWRDVSLYNRQKVVVAIIDDGIYHNHEDLEGRLWLNNNEKKGNKKDDDGNGYVDDFLGYDFVNDTNEMSTLGEHGTAVAGIIGAIKDNEIGIAGISEYAVMMPLIACDQSGCSNDAIIEAIYYAVNNGAQIINLSLGSMTTNGYTEAYDQAIEYAYKNNVVIIVAAGNGDVNGGIGYDLDIIPQSPVCNDVEDNMILGVGSSTEDLKYRTDWTNYGKCVDLFAPGENILSTTVPTDGYLYAEGYTGTSFSAPIITGLAVEVLSAYPKISNKALYNYLQESSINGNVLGVVDAYSLLSSINKKYKNPTLKAADEFSGTISKINPYKNNSETNNDDLLDSNKNSTEETSDFVDIGSSKFKNAISHLKEKGIINGYSDESFKPFNPINRAEFMKIVVSATQTNINGKNCFSDVHEEWFAKYICTGMANGIVGGYPDGTFKPEQNINVVEALKITFKAFDLNVSTKSSDEEWYKPYLEYAKMNNYWLDTFDNINKEITREDMAELIYRIMLR